MRGPLSLVGRLSRGIHTSVRVEVMASLGVVMALALLVLVAAAYRNHENTLRETLGPALLAESRDAARMAAPLGSDTEWWRADASGLAAPVGRARSPATDRELAIARAARERNAALLDFGALWDPIVFAAPPGLAGEVMVARLSPAQSSRLRVRPAAVFAALALADALVFGAFGFVLLQRRVVAPLEALAALVREIGEAGEPVQARIAGPPEARAVAEALSEMSVALARRAKELGDAVVELRETNARLQQTHAGLARAERLASVGRLAAGVAHEVGNPLGAILAFAEIVSRDPGLSATSKGQLERVLREGERVRRILRQLLDLSRPVRMERRPFDLAQVARDTVSLVAAQRRYQGVSFAVSAASDLPLALGDENAAQQVLSNLLVNAAEAVRDGAGARVRIELAAGALRRRSGDKAATPASRATPDAVTCLVLDDGCGIREEDRERVFDPFFSTRTQGEGTGLGLPNALRMAEEQGGSLELDPAPEGFRTAFALRLPAAPSPDRADASRAVRSA